MFEDTARPAMLLRPALVVLATLAAGLAASPSRAADLRMTVQAPHFTCEAHNRGYDQAAFHPGAEPTAPRPCCDGQIGCAQFLSTTTIVRAPHEWRG